MSLVVLVMAGACQPWNQLLPTVEPNEQLHGPADVRIDGDPEVASGPARIRIETPDFADEALISAGERIHAQFNVSDGPYRLVVMPERCQLLVNLATATETDVVLMLGDDGTCS